MKKKSFLISLCLFTLLCVQAQRITPNDGIIYVKTGISGSGNSWSDAADLSDALEYARTTTLSDVAEIWVAAGTYRPSYHPPTSSYPIDRDVTFYLPANIKVYGGFAGITESSTDERDWKANITILSGDIGNVGDNTDNAHHVITITQDNVLLDGFTIQEGNGNTYGTISVDGNNLSRRNGAGIISVEAGGLVLNNLVVTGNSAYSSGGGISFYNCSFSMSHSIIYNNIVTDGAPGGIGLAGAGNCNVKNTLIYSNTASGNGKDMSFSGLSEENPLIVDFENVTVVSGSSAQAVIFNNDTELTLKNSIISTSASAWSSVWGNAGGYYRFDCYNSYVQGVNGSGTSGQYITATTYENSIPGNTDPTGSFFTDIGNSDFSLHDCSPLINAGNNTYVSTDKDLDGKVRINHNIVDLGAYEYQGNYIPAHELKYNNPEDPEGNLLFQNAKQGVAIQDVLFYYTGGATGVTSEGLPNGIKIETGTQDINGNTPFKLTGIADDGFGIYNYTITTTGPVNNCISEDAIEGIIIVSPNVTADENGVLYVMDGGGGCGSSWGEALDDLSIALLANEYNPDISQIWVGRSSADHALGRPTVFTPQYHIAELDIDGNPTTDQDKTFLLLNGVKMYGGFDPQNGITDLTHTRDSSLTVLSGMISPGVNAYHVVTAINLSGIDNNGEPNQIVIDGFTITGGNANGTTSITFGSTDDTHYNIYQNKGGGIYAEAGDGLINIRGNYIHDNAVDGDFPAGGGIYARGYLQITNNRITTNNVSGHCAIGGGIAAFYKTPGNGGGDYQAPIPEDAQIFYVADNLIADNTVSGNNALGGAIVLDRITNGGIQDASSTGIASNNRAVILSNTIINNKVQSSGNAGGGGGISVRYLGDEVSAEDDIQAKGAPATIEGDIIIGYNRIAGNEVSAGMLGVGGGIYINQLANTIVINNVITENTATTSGGGIYLNNYSYGTLLNNTISANTADEGAGMHYEPDTRFYIFNSLIYGNITGEDVYLSENYYDFYGDLYFSHNLVGTIFKEGLSNPPENNDAYGNIIGIDPNLKGGTGDDKYSLPDDPRGSPAINAGEEYHWLSYVSDGHFDFIGNERMRENIDIGAYESILCPPVLIWQGITDDWQTESNWYPEDIPESCTDVYIPGKATTDREDPYLFPNLTGDIADNVCDRIFFMPGAQLGRPDLLTYNEAHVELNYGEGSLLSQATITKEDLVNKGKDGISSADRIAFGAETSGIILERGRWNMLSAPLNEIVTGDFAFGGFPFSYIKKFAADGSESSYLMGKWADFDSETDLKFQPGQGFGHYYFDYLTNTPYGMDNSEGDTQWEAAKNYNGLVADAPRHVRNDGTEFGLAQSNGILHFPYFADKHLSDTRRAHQYSGTTQSGTSSFNFYYQSPMKSSDYLKWTGNYETVSRTADAYRFITDGRWNFTYNAGIFNVGDVVLIGNPYMSALDFDAFYNENSARIKKVYHIYKGRNDGYHTYGTEGITEETTGDPYLAPMQSFLIEIAADGNLDLIFDATAMATTNAETKLRKQPAPRPNHLTITASNPYGDVSTYIRQATGASDAFCTQDFSKLIDMPGNLPEIYTLVNTTEGKSRALLQNSILSNRLIIPMGFTSTYRGDISLSMKGMDNYDAIIHFIDAEDNIETDITGLPDFTYTFTHSPTGDNHTVEGRFTIRLTPDPVTEVNNNTDATTEATLYGNDLIVITSDNNPIKRVELYDIRGSLLSKTQTQPGISYCKIENIVHQTGVYIVRVHTLNQVKDIKVIR